MKRLLLVGLLAFGCTSEYERTYGESEAEYEKRVSACDIKAAAGEYVFTLVDSDRWRVGTTPFWSTAEQVRATLGPPDTSYQEVVWIAGGPDLEYHGYNRPSAEADGYLDVTVINDSLTYISHADLGAEPLVTDRGRFQPGAPLAEIRAAFSNSYECLDWSTAGGSYRDQFYPVLVATDSARGAHIALLFREGRLHSIGTDYYMQDIEHGPIPQ